MVWGTAFGDKVPQSARLSAGGGGQKLKGQCPNAPCMNLRKASLNWKHLRNLQYQSPVAIVAKKWEPGNLVPSRFSGQIRKVEARLGKLAKIRKVETN